ncbi:hypothetical protein evm_010103 [Chilo suppressalis]|nr:hypothetical protein evm_010103 [Chilo suppressalis]
MLWALWQCRGTSTNIDQYPWLALLEYKLNNEIQLRCGGFLISNKYVLTAAHCTSNDTKPVSVRLGEYDITNPGEDCVDVAGGGQDCTSPAVSIPIKEIIKHPEYDTVLKRNDIALIRLDGEANYTDFVRPICLPTSDVSTSAQLSNLTVHVAGWGKMSWNIQNSALKQYVNVPIVDVQNCQNAYSAKISPTPQLWSKQLCAGGKRGKDSCNGDSGGPLMLETERETGPKVFTAEGVVSFGALHCGLEGVPGVYTKVHSYNTWIRQSIRP